MSRSRSFFFFFVVLGLTSCIADSPNLDLLDGQEQDEWETRRRRMDVTVQQLGPNGWDAPEQVQTEDTLELVLTYCGEQVIDSSASFGNCAPGKLFGGTPLDCGEAVCLSQVATCMSLTYLELAQAVTTTELLWHDSNNAPQGLRVPPQSTASVASFAEFAQVTAQIATVTAGENLRQAMGDATAAGVCTAGELDDYPALPAPESGDHRVTLGEMLAGTLVEASRNVEVAALDAVRANVAVADADLTREPNRSAASRAAWTAPVLSRLHATHLLTGGGTHPLIDVEDEPPYDPRTISANYPDVMTHGMCGTVACESESCRRALDMIRDSGMSVDIIGDVPRFAVDTFGEPTWVDGMAVDDLLATGGGGIQPRLAERYGLAELATMPATDFLERMQVSRTDVDEARTFLIAEAGAFDRDAAQIVPATPLAGGTMPTFTRYAATALPPARPDAALFVAGARSRLNSLDHRPDPAIEDFAYPNATAAYSGGAAGTTDYAQTVAMQIVRANSYDSPILNILGVLVSQAFLSDSARLEQCYRHTGTAEEIRVRVYGTDDLSAYQIVSGTAGLQCATTGRVEGQTCRLTDYKTSFSTAVTTGVDARVGYDKYIQATIAVAGTTGVAIERMYYVVRLRAGAPNQAAGNYESVGEANFGALSTTEDGWKWCHLTPIEPELLRRAGEAMTPNPAACGQPENDCFGAPLTGELPLENDLIDDGDAFETSWRHHLVVARQAAERADQLGEELIQAGLAMDQRAEGAIEALQATCGSDVSVDGLFGPSGAGFGSALERVIDGPCVSGSCEDGYRCLGTTCVLDPVASAAGGPADAQMLAECLGEDESVVPVASLGTRPLCYWYDDDSPNVICSPGGSRPCPWLRRSNDPPCNMDGIAPAGNTITESTEALGIFSTGDAVGARVVEPLESCSLIREIRDADPGERGAMIDELVRTNFFAISNVRHWAERIGWSGYPLDFSMLTLDGAPWYGTGIPFASMSDAPGPSAYWPCVAGSTAFRDTAVVPGPDCPPGSSGLFCNLAASCTDAEDRAVFNDRLARAALALAITSGVGVAHFRLPLVRPADPSETVFNMSTLRGDRVEDDWRTGEFSWRIGGFGTWTTFGAPIYHVEGIGTEPPNQEFSGLYAFPSSPETDVWHREDGTAFRSTVTQPLAFVAPGSLTADWAARRAEALWGGLSEGPSADVVDELTRNCMGGRSSVVLHSLEASPIAGSGGMEITSNDRCDNLLSGQLSTYWIEPYGFWGVGAGDRRQRFGANVAMIADGGLRTRDIVDGLEVMCEAARYGTEVLNCDPTDPPEVNGSGDIPALRAYLNCLANRLEQSGERLVLQNVPQRVVDAIQSDPMALRPDEGEHGRTLVRLRDSLREMERLPRSIAAQVHQFADDLELFQIALAQIEARRELSDLSAMSEVFGQTAACISSAGSNNVAGGIATCANAVAQIAIQFRIGDINESMLDDEGRVAFIDFRTRWQARQGVMQDLANDILHASESINSDLSSLASARRSARRNLAYALFADSDEAGNLYQVNTVMRRIYNTRLERYRDAHRSAVQMAVLARRALEQRLGVHLEDFHEEMSLVDAPASWVGSVCESSGIDYARIRDATELPADNFADAYVGDYVNRLDRFFESYLQDYPHTSGSDLSVVSLRDDIQNVRQTCYANVPNLLAASNSLESRDASGVGIADDFDPAWTERGCTVFEDESVTACVHVVPISGGPTAVDRSVDARPMLGILAGHVPQAYRVVFAAGTDGTVLEPAGVSWTDQTELAQSVDVTTGMYRLSWYGGPDSSGTEPQVSVQLLPSDGAPSFDASSVLTSESPVDTMDGILASNWYRYVRYYRVSAPGEARVRIFPGFIGEPIEHSVVLAGLQLERTAVTAFPTQMQLDAGPETFAPLPFVATSNAAKAKLPVCEDTTGEVFRTNWQYSCSRLCDGGFGSCAAGETDYEYRCYWESEFNVSREQMEAGSQFGSAGVALGNFNYRIDSLGLNFVGSAARVCADANLPSTCHNAGWIPYSIEHLPPYDVQSYDGTPYEAPLVIGRIEMANGLAAERYITNPMSSADRSLMDGYMRQELRGRPLSGRFIVRVWELPGVNFSGIEDVQLVLNYRYATRTPRTRSR